MHALCDGSDENSVKSSVLEQEPPNHKIDGGIRLHPPSSTSIACEQALLG